MNEHEAFIRAIVDNPKDDSPRQGYAQWLEEGYDLRAAYIRAELDWAKSRDVARERELRKLAASFHPIWVARVSRPPVGVCFQHQVFEYTGPRITLDDIQSHGHEIPYLPDDYIAFLLNYNGGYLAGDRGAGYCDGFSRLGLETPGRPMAAPITKPQELPTIQGLANQLCHPNVSSMAWGGSSDRIFTDCTVIGFSQAEFGCFHSLLLRKRAPQRGKQRQRVLYYSDPNGVEQFWGDDLESDEDYDRVVARFKPERHAETVSESFCEFLAEIDHGA